MKSRLEKLIAKIKSTIVVRKKNKKNKKVHPKPKQCNCGCS